MVRVVKKPEERRREIIEMACRLFLSKGYESATMKDVMHELGIAKGTIYHYFGSKDELLDAVIDHIAEVEVERLRVLLESFEGNALERMEQLVIANTKSFNDDDHEHFIEHLHEPSNAGMHIRLLAKHITIQAPLYAELINLGCQEGIFSTTRPLESAEFILSGVRFLTDTGIHQWSKDQLERRLSSFPSLIESLLNAPEGSFAFLLKVNELVHQ